MPGTSGIGGFWPGIWAMGNLGRPGYGASTDGMSPCALMIALTMSRDVAVSEIEKTKRCTDIVVDTPTIRAT